MFSLGRFEKRFVIYIVMRLQGQAFNGRVDTLLWPLGVEMKQQEYKS